MRKFVATLICALIRSILWFRYRVRTEGLEKVNKETLKRPGGVLFLANHPTVFIDPAVVTLGVWSRFPIRPMIVEYFYFQPVVNSLMRFMNALPVPDFDISSNSLKRKKSEDVIQTVIDDLKKGDNFLIAPAGRTKQTGYEAIGGASAVHRILQANPNTNVVLVRSKGLWGSSFSRAFTGRSPPMFPTIFSHVKDILKNFIFFSPRRKVTVEYQPAPADFPYNASKIELNRWLENWYNRPDHLTEQKGEHPGDSLVLVPYTIWSNEVPTPMTAQEDPDKDINLEDIPEDVRDKVTQELSQITDIPAEEIKPEMALDVDLGMDSLDVADLGSFLQSVFDVKTLTVAELTTVKRCMAIAAGKYICKEAKIEEVRIDFNKWFTSIQKERRNIAPGNTIPEVFLNNCARMGNAIACGDERAGLLTYKDLKLRTILLAEYIRHLPGEYIGILLPSSVASYAVILACQLAGKVPLMINWTVGARHLQAVKSLSNVQVVLSSWAFLDRLENVNLDGIEDNLIMLEDARRGFTIKDKIRAFVRSKKGTQSILKAFNIDNLSKNSKAVLLFTSGTESLPKGVPLSHYNILSNQRSAFEVLEIFSDDIMLGMLPPFHSFGFTISGLLCLLAGVRIVYSPDPTDGKKLATIVKDWGVTITCGAPTFLKTMFKMGPPEYFKTVRLCVTGAEKAPPELFMFAETIGKGMSIIEGYGITECSPILTANLPGHEAVGVGSPLPGIHLKIINPETSQVLGPNQQGLILARGPNIFSGYINPDVSSPFITIEGEDWYKTGDLGYIDDKGNLIIGGRQKRFIKVGGEMISLASIEDALLKEASKKQWPVFEEGPILAVCAKETPGEKPRVVLFTRFHVHADEINATLKELGFSNIVKVNEVKELGEIPIMGTGKINYRLLETTYMA